MFQVKKKIQESLDLTESLVLSSPRVLCLRSFLLGPGSSYDSRSWVFSIGFWVLDPHRVLCPAHRLLGPSYSLLGPWSIVLIGSWAWALSTWFWVHGLYMVCIFCRFCRVLFHGSLKISLSWILSIRCYVWGASNSVLGPGSWQGLLLSSVGMPL